MGQVIRQTSETNKSQKYTINSDYNNNNPLLTSKKA